MHGSVGPTGNANCLCSDNKCHVNCTNKFGCQERRQEVEDDQRDGKYYAFYKKLLIKVSLTPYSSSNLI